MRAICEEFFAARMPVAGLAACVVRLPDGMLIHRCFNRWLLPAQVRQAMTHLTQAPEIFRRHQVEAARMVWSFEHLRIHFGFGQENACLALFLENRPDLPFSEIETLLDDFAQLPAS
jgi:hypothetical protein